MKITAVVIAVLLSVGLLSPAAQADTPHCVSKKEFRKIRVSGFHGPLRTGMTQRRVTRVFDVPGKRHPDWISGNWRHRYRAYNACKGRRYMVQYAKRRHANPYRAVEKWRL